MEGSQYTDLSLPICSESGYKSSSGRRLAAKVIASVSGLLILGYFMSATHFSTPEGSAMYLNSSEARLSELVDQYQIKLVSTPEIVAKFGNALNIYPNIALSKDISLAVFENPQSEIEVWNVHKKELVTKFIHCVKSYDGVKKLIFTPDGKYLISITDWDDFVKIWDLGSKSLYGQIEVKHGPSSLFVTSDSKFVVYHTINEVSVWDITNFKKAYSLKVHDYSDINNIAITPDGRYLAMAISGESNIIQVYDITTSNKIADIDTESQLYYLQISHDGKILEAATPWGNSTNVWNIETGKLITKLELGGSVGGIGLSPDGRFLWSAYSLPDITIVYDLKANKIIREIKKFVNKNTFTKDSKFLLIPYSDYTEGYQYDIQVLDLKTNKQVATLKHQEPITDLALSENGEYLLVSSVKSAYLWSLRNLYN